MVSYPDYDPSVWIKGVDQKTYENIQFSILPDPYWTVVHQGMTMVTQPGGTAVIPFQGFPYSIAAKTGTSQQDIYANRKRFEIENATFVGYSPADNPKLAVAVVVPEGGFGSNSASYIARGIFDIYDKYVGLKQ